MRKEFCIEEGKEESGGEGNKEWKREERERMRERQRKGKRQREGEEKKERKREERRHDKSKNSFCSTAVPIIEMGTLKLLLKSGMVSAQSRARTRPLYNLSLTVSGPVLAHETLWIDHFLDSPGSLVDCCLLQWVEGNNLTSPTTHPHVECLGDAWVQEVPARVCVRKDKTGMGISQCPPFQNSSALHVESVS